MDYLRQRLLQTRQWLHDCNSTGLSSPELEDEDDDAVLVISNNATDHQYLTDHDGFELVPHRSLGNFGVVSVRDSQAFSQISFVPSSGDATTVHQCAYQGCTCCCIEHSGTRFADDPSITRADASLLEQAGRGDHAHAFRDMRSSSRVRQRERCTRQKYFNFKHVKRGDLGAPFYQTLTTSGVEQLALQHSPQATMTKSELYRQAQLPPRPPKYHRRHVDKIYGTLSNRVDVRREDRKHGKAILQGVLEDLDDGYHVDTLVWLYHCH